MELVVSFQMDDVKLIKALEEQFGNAIRYEENKTSMG